MKCESKSCGMQIRTGLPSVSGTMHLACEVTDEHEARQEDLRRQIGDSACPGCGQKLWELPHYPRRNGWHTECLTVAEAQRIARTA